MNGPGKARSQEDLVIRTFDEKAGGYADGYRGGSSTAHSFNIRLQRVFELIEGRHGGRALDVGCGPGLTVEYLLDKGFEVYGVDISKEMIDECEKRFGRRAGAHFSVGRIEALDFPDGFFDAVLCMGVVEYVDDDRAAVAEMARVTKPGGAIVVTLPNRASPYRLWQRTAYRAVRSTARWATGRAGEPEVAHREYSETSYRALLASCGLKVTDVVYYNFSVLLFPLDRLFPRLSVSIAKKMERFGRGSTRWLGTGFIVRAEKP